MATQLHPPPITFVMLFGLALTSALLAGFGMSAGKARSWVHMVGYAGALAATVYVIIDLEYPRFGFIRVDAFDRVLVRVRDEMR